VRSVRLTGLALGKARLGDRSLEGPLHYFSAFARNQRSFQRTGHPNKQNRLTTTPQQGLFASLYPALDLLRPMGLSSCKKTASAYSLWLPPQGDLQSLLELHQAWPCHPPAGGRSLQGVPLLWQEFYEYHIAL
jgi:hypothetical protein